MRRRTAVRHELVMIDRALVRLMDERARLMRALGDEAGDARAREAARDDLLRRSSGAFPAEHLTRVLDALDAGVQEGGR